MIGVTSALFLRCAISAPSVQTVALQKWFRWHRHGVKPTSVVELRSCATDRQCTRTECSSRQALLSGDHEVTACERAMGQDNSANIFWCVASAELTSSVLMILSTLNTMRTSEGHKEVSCRRGFTWRFCRGCHVVTALPRSAFHCHVVPFTATWCLSLPRPWNFPAFLSF